MYKVVSCCRHHILWGNLVCSNVFKSCKEIWMFELNALVYLHVAFGLPWTSWLAATYRLADYSGCKQFSGTELCCNLGMTCIGCLYIEEVTLHWLLDCGRVWIKFGNTFYLFRFDFFFRNNIEAPFWVFIGEYFESSVLNGDTGVGAGGGAVVSQEWIICISYSKIFSHYGTVLTSCRAREW